MTRRCAHINHTPSEEMIAYYARRANAGLIVTEGSLISADAIGYGNVPGIFTDQHINAWLKITEAIHNKNGYIFLQLWHCGRVSHSKFHQGKLPISASATQLNLALGSTKINCSPSREATNKEIKQLISNYVDAAKNAIAAGFDGVEIHGANGYLIDQFLHYCSNKRTDDYGVTPENMARFALDVVNECGKSIGYDRVGFRISPGGHMNGISTDNRDKFVFSYLLDQLSNLKIAYVHTGTFDDSIIFPELDKQTMTDFIRSKYTGTVIASGGYNLDTASKAINQKKFDLIAIGRLFIANHDLIFKLKNKDKLQTYYPEMLQQELY